MDFICSSFDTRPIFCRTSGLLDDGRACGRMIACRFYRVDHLLVSAAGQAILNPRKNFKGCYIYHGFSNSRRMSGIQYNQNFVSENKKQKLSTMWLSMHSESSPCEELLEVDLSRSSPPDADFGHLEVKGREAVGSNGESAPFPRKHSASVEVATSLHRFIKGKGCSIQKKIEEDFSVRLIFSTSKKLNSIEIESDSTQCISKASEKIQTLIQEAIRSPCLDYSHFVSLPLAIHGELLDKLVNFQKSILSDDSFREEICESDSDDDSTNNEEENKECASDVNLVITAENNDELNTKRITTDIQVVSYPVKTSKFSNLSALRIDKSIFIKPKTFHLTVLMLKLWNKERVDAATMVLQRISSKVAEALGSRPVFVKLKGLACMRGSLANAHVLYAPVEEVGNENRLLQACQVIIDAYVEAGLVLEKDAQQKLKLHATVMNARHRKRKRTKRHDSFDARDIVAEYGGEEWGEYLIREAHLSERFLFDEDGYYHCCSSIPFPMVAD